MTNPSRFPLSILLLLLVLATLFINDANATETPDTSVPHPHIHIPGDHYHHHHHDNEHIPSIAIDGHSLDDADHTIDAVGAEVNHYNAPSPPSYTPSIDLSTISQLAALKIVTFENSSSIKVDFEMLNETLHVEMAPLQDVIGSNYEEVEHETPDNPVDGDSLTIPVNRRKQGVINSLDRCMYRGKVVADDDSIVSVTTCSGVIKGWIFLGSTGQHFSIENTPKQNLLKTRARHNPVEKEVLLTQQNAARRGDFPTLVDLIQYVVLVDANMESAAEEAQNRDQ